MHHLKGTHRDTAASTEVDTGSKNFAHTWSWCLGLFSGILSEATFAGCPPQPSQPSLRCRRDRDRSGMRQHHSWEADVSAHGSSAFGLRPSINLRLVTISVNCWQGELERVA